MKVKKEIPRLYVLNDPTVLRIVPSLAKEIGLNESIMLLQIDFLKSISNTDIKHGRPWTYQSIRQLQEEYFPFWSKDTINRAISGLQQKRLIRCSNFNKAAYDRTRWISINYGKCRSLESVQVVGTLSQNATRSTQNATRSTQNATTIPETSSETSAEKREPANATAFTNPRTFEHKNTPKKSKVISDQECNHILNIMREHDKGFNRTQEIIKLITQSIKHNGFEETEKAVKGRLMVKKGKDKSWRWLFVGNSDYLDALAAYDKENAADEDMRKRWSPAPTEVTAEELSELEARLAEI